MGQGNTYNYKVEPLLAVFQPSLEHVAAGHRASPYLPVKNSRKAERDSHLHAGKAASN